MPIRLIRAAACIVTMGALAGCASSGANLDGPAPELTPMQRAAIQTKEIAGDLDTVWNATISVLQDHGYQIDEVDKDGGVIQASSPRRQAAAGPGEAPLAAPTKKQVKSETERRETWTCWERVSVFIEPWTPDSVRERITLVQCGVTAGGLRYVADDKGRPLPVIGGARERQAVVDDAQVYQRLFQQIRKAVFVRQGLRGNQ